MTLMLGSEIDTTALNWNIANKFPKIDDRPFFKSPSMDCFKLYRLTASFIGLFNGFFFTVWIVLNCIYSQLNCIGSQLVSIINLQKQSSGGVLWKRCSYKFRKIHRKTPSVAASESSFPEQPFSRKSLNIGFLLYPILLFCFLSVLIWKYLTSYS